MQEAGSGTAQWARWMMLTLAGAAVLFCAGPARLLYTDPAPFHQSYRESTDAQDLAVTRRMIAALVGAPLSLAAIVIALAGPRLAQRPKRWGRILACIFLLNALQSGAVYLSLPYGFGSGYQHTKEAQLAHMTWARNAFMISLALGGRGGDTGRQTEPAPPLRGLSASVREFLQAIPDPRAPTGVRR